MHFSFPALLLDIPPIKPTQPPGTEWLNTLLGWIAFGAGLACVAGFLISAARLGISARGGEYEGGKGLVLAMVAFGIIGAVGTIFGAITVF